MKLFVWDFHGVLEKDTEHGVLIISNKVLEDNGYSGRFTFDEIKGLYGKHWWMYFAYLLLDKRVKIDNLESFLSLNKNDDLLNKCFKLQEDCFTIGSTRESIINHTKPNDYVKYVLDKIVSAGDELVLISNCNHEALPFFMEAACVTNYFTNNFFAVDAHRDPSRTKAKVLTDFLIGKNYDEVIIIGDSKGDMILKQVAESLGFKSTSYLYSHPDVPFRDCEADYKIHDLREVLPKDLSQIFSVNRFKDFDCLKKVYGKWTEIDELRSKFNQ